MDQPEAADVIAAASGDLGAFERLVRQMEGPVFRYIVHLIGDRALAEDVAQEVFLRMYRSLHTLRDADRFVPWLLATARNAAYDAGRRRARDPIELVGDRELPARAEDPHLTVEISDALSRLEHDLAEAIVLVGMVGLSYAEAAATIGIPEGTMKSRVFRARKVLMQILEGGDRG
ncbi:MAG: RNA polymerase sigma factor [Actinobacteria bacterium]|nr:RNA polymerase sigma factor [Actinomycetota bacterium]